MLSILITSYNRPQALKACLDAIAVLDLEIPYEVVVSDDASTSENLAVIQQLKGVDVLLTTKFNQGLGANLNKGIKACKGDYLLYCQEDFILKKEIKTAIMDALELIEAGKLDMVRFQANYRFPKLIPMAGSIFQIPSFSWRNFKVNTFRYSDNPFVCKPSLFECLDYFMEGVRGDYGETEFAIRVLYFKLKIGITQPYLVEAHQGSTSTIRSSAMQGSKGVKKKLLRLARAFRQHLEWFFYRPKHRGLLTYSKIKR
jgi:glycosyltransferase involved in cell wall biosynthesis